MDFFHDKIQAYNRLKIVENVSSSITNIFSVSFTWLLAFFQIPGLENKIAIFQVFHDA